MRGDVGRQVDLEPLAGNLVDRTQLVLAVDRGQAGIDLKDVAPRDPIGRQIGLEPPAEQVGLDPALILIAGHRREGTAGIDRLARRGLRLEALRPAGIERHARMRLDDGAGAEGHGIVGEEAVADDAVLEPVIAHAADQHHRVGQVDPILKITALPLRAGIAHRIGHLRRACRIAPGMAVDRIAQAERRHAGAQDSRLEDVGFVIPVDPGLEMMRHAQQRDARGHVGHEGQSVDVADLVAKLARDQMAAAPHQPARLVIMLGFDRIEIAHARIEVDRIADRRGIARLIGLRRQAQEVGRLVGIPADVGQEIAGIVGQDAAQPVAAQIVVIDGRLHRQRTAPVGTDGQPAVPDQRIVPGVAAIGRHRLVKAAQPVADDAVLIHRPGRLGGDAPPGIITGGRDQPHRRLRIGHFGHIIDDAAR